MFKLIKKVSGAGIVYAVDRGYVLIITPSENENCNKQTKICGGCGGCANAQKKRGDHDIKIYVGVEKAKNITAGSRVTYMIHTPEPNVTALLFFGVPVIFSFTPILLVPYLTHFKCEEQERDFTRTISVTAFIVGLFLVSMIDKIFKRIYPAQIFEEKKDA